MEYVASAKMDAETLQSMRDIFKSLAQADEDVTIDMNAVDYIDGSGVGALVYILKRVRAKRHAIRLINLKGQPKRLFQELRLMLYVEE
jgi:anti-anti-sigma factor